MINDEFTHLVAKFGRQRVWQLRRQRDGLCHTCGQPALPGFACCELCRAKRQAKLVRKTTWVYNTKYTRLMASKKEKL